MVSLALWIGGVVLIVLAVLQARGPFARLSELDRLAENARRYDSWRGGRRPSSEDATTGADVMRQVLRRKVLLWAGVAAVGVVLVVVGFAVR
jgi:hypothetical protein